MGAVCSCEPAEQNGISRQNVAICSHSSQACLKSTCDPSTWLVTVDLASCSLFQKHPT